MLLYLEDQRHDMAARFAGHCRCRVRRGKLISREACYTPYFCGVVIHSPWLASRHVVPG